MRIVLAGGGTGGHLYPALSLAKALCGAPADHGVCSPLEPSLRPPFEAEPAAAQASRQALPPQLLFVGTGDDLVREALAATDVASAAVASAPLANAPFHARASAVALNAAGFAQAVRLLHRFAPDVLIGTGGYASGPVVAAGALLRRLDGGRPAKIILLEPNAAPGLANRVLARTADEVWGAYEETAPAFGSKFVRTGTPVRPEFYALPTKDAARRALGLAPDLLTIVAVGGSQGARSINLALSGMVARRKLPPHWQILHVSGRRDHAWMAAERKAEPNGNRYGLLPYAEAMHLVLAAADVAVSRAGASTIAELAVAAVPSLLVPYPHAAGDHQRANAELFRRRGAARVIDDSELGADSLYWQLVQIAEPAMLQSMSAAASTLAEPRALHLMVDRILALCT